MAPIDRPKTDRFCCHALELGPDNGSPENLSSRRRELKSTSTFRVPNRSFSTGGCRGAGSRPRLTSRSKGLYYKCHFLVVIEKLAAGADVRRPLSLMRGWNFENITASGRQFLDRERLHRLNDQARWF